MTMPQADHPAARFRPFFNPATGELIEYIVTAENSDGQHVRFRWRSAPGSVIPEHVHPRQEERFSQSSPAKPASPSTARNTWPGRARPSSYLLLPPLWAVAKVFGVRPYYDRWDSRT